MPLPRRAFSLVELSVVLTIAGIIAGAVALRLEGPLRKARLADALSAIRDYDLTTRAAARNQDRPLRMDMDPSGGQLKRCDDQGLPCGGPPLALPTACRIERLVLGGAGAPGQNTTIRCSRRGLTPTYAFLLRAQEGRQWVVVAGLTGQQVLVENEQDVNEILAAAAGRVAH
jgi:prepilin-type N-terminal cleavage/methylation domain-containing protein